MYCHVYKSRVQHGICPDTLTFVYTLTGRETDDLQYRVIMTLISLQTHLMVASMIDYFTPTRSGDVITLWMIDDNPLAGLVRGGVMTHWY